MPIKSDPRRNIKNIIHNSMKGLQDPLSALGLGYREASAVRRGDGDVKYEHECHQARND